MIIVQCVAVTNSIKNPKVSVCGSCITWRRFCMFMFDFCDVKKSFNHFISSKRAKYRHSSFNAVFGPWKNRVKGKARYRRSILVLKPKNREHISSKSTFSLGFTNVKLQLQSLHLYISKDGGNAGI